MACTLLPIAVVLSAALLFAVQPLAGRYALPWFGGAPATWAACLAFFQLAVLGGYAWAALLLRWPVRRQALAHGLLLVAACAMLPLRFAGGWADAGGPPALRVLAMLAGALGLPALALATTMPLLQGWHARLVPGEPYRLSAWSNAGALLALLAMPFLVDRWLGRGQQALAWSVGFALFALAILVLAAVVARRGGAAAAPLAPAGPPPSPGQRLRWLLLPAAGSALLAALSETLIQDVAPVPLLWVAPLAIYLLSWIAAFAGPRGYARPAAVALTAVASAATVALQAVDGVPLALDAAAHLLALAAACWFCHGEFARLRPEPARLGGYWLASALGGAAGGLAVAVAAPLLLTTRSEPRVLLLLVLAAALLALRARPLRLPAWGWGLAALAVAALVVVSERIPLAVEGTIAARRTFFGTLAVREREVDDPRRHRRVLLHGATMHGVQLRDPLRRREPTAYYGTSSGVGIVLRADDAAAHGRRVGVVGLGAGTLAAYARAGDAWRFYEIDAAVEAIAESRFTYLADARARGARVATVIGDARRTLAAERDVAFDVLVLDAFSGDAVPAHLLTREAFALWRDRLAPRGLIAVHISNRHLDLRPVVVAAAARLGWDHATIEDEPDADMRGIDEDSTWILLGPDPTRFLQEDIRRRARGPDYPPRLTEWTDERVDIVGVLR